MTTQLLTPAMAGLLDRIGCDPVADEGLACADTLRAAGVPVRPERLRGVTHDGVEMGRALPQAHQALDAAAAALKEAMPR